MVFECGGRRVKGREDDGECSLESHGDLRERVATLDRSQIGDEGKETSSYTSQKPNPTREQATRTPSARSSSTPAPSSSHRPRPTTPTTRKTASDRQLGTQYVTRSDSDHPSFHRARSRSRGSFQNIPHTSRRLEHQSQSQAQDSSHEALQQQMHLFKKEVNQRGLSRRAGFLVLWFC